MRVWYACVEVTKSMQVDKVAYLRELQALPSAAARRAQLLLMQGRPALAEEALLSARHVWGAVELSVRQFAWPRALALAQQAGDARMLEAVLWFRCAPPSAQTAARVAYRFLCASNPSVLLLTALLCCMPACL